MRILVVCGAGASSTFVAQRLRAAASRHGEDVEVSAGTEATLGDLSDPVDLVLVGPHLADALGRIQDRAAAGGALCVLLPPDVFADREGSRLFETVRTALSASTTEQRSPGGNHD